MFILEIQPFLAKAKLGHRLGSTENATTEPETKAAIIPKTVE
jgi:hypothetical protein